MGNNYGLMTAKKNELWSLIKRLGKLTGEDKLFLESYAKEVYEAYRFNIDTALTCFKDLVKQVETLS